MNVLAFSIPSDSQWRWRIVDYGGATVEESSLRFSTIAEAVAAGNERLTQQADRDRQNRSWGR